MSPVIRLSMARRTLFWSGGPSRVRLFWAVPVRSIRQSGKLSPDLFPRGQFARAAFLARPIQSRRLIRSERFRILLGGPQARSNGVGRRRVAQVFDKAQRRPDLRFWQHVDGAVQTLVIGRPIVREHVSQSECVARDDRRGAVGVTALGALL